jgi:hypothetical protein
VVDGEHLLAAHRPALGAALLAALLALAPGCADTRLAPSWPGSYVLVAERGERALAEIDPNGGRVRRRFDAEGATTAVAVSRNGQYAVTLTESGRYVVRDLALERRDGAHDLARPAQPVALVFADRRSTLLVGGAGSGELAFLARGSARVERALDTGSSAVRALATAPPWTAWAACAGPPQLVGVDLEQRELRARLPLEAVPIGLAVADAGRELWVAFEGLGELAVLDASGGGTATRVEVGPAPLAIEAADEAGLICVSVAAQGELVLLDRARREIVARVALGTPQPAAAAPWPVLADPDARHAFVALPAEDRVAVVDLATRALRGSIPTGRGPAALAWAFRRDGFGPAFERERGADSD